MKKETTIVIEKSDVLEFMADINMLSLHRWLVWHYERLQEPYKKPTISCANDQISLVFDNHILTLEEIQKLASILGEIIPSSMGRWASLNPNQ
jgi:hypothetical protein